MSMQPSHGSHSPNTVASDDGIGLRRRWMGLLARGEPSQLELAWAGLPGRPTYRLVRKPEAGLFMIRARAGGTGQQFNLGETAVSRCAVTTDQGYLGIGYVHGRHLRHAELAAAFDGALQDARLRAAIEREVLAPIAERIAEQDRLREIVSASTKVEFFTLVRGEDT